MFRDLARMTASLKGPRYEGALIARAVWERGEDGAGSGMRILRDHHGLLEVVAYDGSGRLTVTMMLGRSAPTRERTKGRALSLLVDGTPAKEQLSLCFSAEAVHAFVQSVGDTNALHAGPAPLVPGLAILEAALLQLSGDDVRRAELRFRGASFAGETIEVAVQQRRAAHGPACWPAGRGA